MNSPNRVRASLQYAYESRFRDGFDRLTTAAIAFEEQAGWDGEKAAYVGPAILIAPMLTASRELFDLDRKYLGGEAGDEPSLACPSEAMDRTERKLCKAAYKYALTSFAELDEQLPVRISGLCWAAVEYAEAQHV